MSELKNCPFCNGIGEINKIGNEYHKKQVATIVCTTMGCFAEARVGFLTGRHDYEWALGKVIEHWNTRAADKTIADLREALKFADTQLGNAFYFIKENYSTSRELREIRLEQINEAKEKIEAALQAAKEVQLK